MERLPLRAHLAGACLATATLVLPACQEAPATTRLEPSRGTTSVAAETPSTFPVLQAAWTRSQADAQPQTSPLFPPPPLPSVDSMTITPHASDFEPIVRFAEPLPPPPAAPAAEPEGPSPAPAPTDEPPRWTAPRENENRDEPDAANTQCDSGASAVPHDGHPIRRLPPLTAEPAVSVVDPPVPNAAGLSRSAYPAPLPVAAARESAPLSGESETAGVEVTPIRLPAVTPEPAAQLLPVPVNSAPIPDASHPVALSSMPRATAESDPVNEDASTQRELADELPAAEPAADAQTPAETPWPHPESTIDHGRSEQTLLPVDPESARFDRVVRDPAVEALSRRVLMTVAQAESLAARGAMYGARADLIQALRSITQMHDMRAGTRDHSRALADAVRALQEVDDFAPPGAELDADLDLASVVEGHRTRVLSDGELAVISPLAAQQRYLAHAQDRLAFACGHLPAGSRALYCLGRIYAALDQRSAESVRLAVPKAITLYQAALLVDARNSLAANELGVLLARSGRLQDARRVLQHGVSVGCEAELWRNLAQVHQQLGEVQLAGQAEQQWRLAQAQRAERDGADDAVDVQWVAPNQFRQPPSTP